MRNGILHMLRENVGSYVSGEEISRRFAVSRTAIWKRIQALKHEGYDIEGHSRLGYRLCRLPDLLLPEEICAHLTTKVLGRKIYYLPEVNSTSSEAKKMAAEGCPEGLIVVAETQKAGRGRLSRAWFSPFGKGIWFSVVLRPPFSPQEASKCTMMAAVAVNKAIKKMTGITCGIKWPNDILHNDRKLVGILTEMAAEIDAVNYIVIGIGVNVNIAEGEFPAELAETATSLSIAAGQAISRVELFAAILKELENIYFRCVEEGLTSILDEWRAETVSLGRTVDIFGLNRNFSGVAVDIDNDGALLIATENGMEKVVAGDVSLRARKKE